MNVSVIGASVIFVGAIMLAGFRYPACEHVAGWFDYGGFDATGVPGK